MTIPVTTTLDQQPDEGSSGERRGVHLTLLREESPAVKPFPEIPAVAKPLNAFEELPSRSAAPLTWDPGNS